MSIYMTPAFWQGARKGTVKTFAQALLGVLMGGATGRFDVDWVAALSVAGLATVGSILTSLAIPDFTAGAPQTTTTRAGTKPPHMTGTRRPSSPAPHRNTPAPASCWDGGAFVCRGLLHVEVHRFRAEITHVGDLDRLIRRIINHVGGGPGQRLARTDVD